MNKGFEGTALLTLCCGLLGIASASCGETATEIATGPEETELPPGALCFAPDPAFIRMRFEPRFVVMPENARRNLRLVVDPDFCSPTTVTFESSNPDVSSVPADGTVDYASPTIDFEIAGETLGSTTITATLNSDDGTASTAQIDIEVADDDAIECNSNDDVAATRLSAGSEVSASNSMSGTSIALPEGADAPNDNAFLWSVQPFDVSLSCADDLDLPDFVALGPAIAFGPADTSLPRDLPMSIPVNLARLPDAARLRHLQVAYSGPAFKAPRTVAVTDPRVEKSGDTWMLRFRAPRFGTYQAVAALDAGTRSFSRRFTHRAVLGVSMGGAGAAQFGLRNHHLFDVVAPLGGPVDWTYMIDHMEHNQLAGFRAIAPGTTLDQIQLEKTTCQNDSQCADDETCLGVTDTAPGRCTLLPAADEPYEHASTFVNWWYEFPKTGHGGSFDRTQYAQIFRDLALMFGNPNGYNPLSLNLPAGVDPEHPSQTGDHDNGECKIWVDPYDGPNEEKQKQIEDECPVERCKYTQTFQGYYDDEYNPDGTFPVITFCDGTPQLKELTPYADTWTDESVDFPLEVALAVDNNNNGKRDELEPVIRAGHEHWDDWGSDGVASQDEPGYSADNLDPAGDDYDPQYNPTGTEGDKRRQEGEPFLDYGLDGVANTADSPYDYGEGDGLFTTAPGLANMWAQDARSVVRRFNEDIPSGPLDDAALRRLDVWTDGGTRDLFNFLVAARHLTGGFQARERNAVYFSEFTQLPGLDPTTPTQYNPSHIVWEDLQGVVMQRYGADEPSATEIETGSGQHVGTVNEIARRLQSALYFAGSRWRDAPHYYSEVSQDKPAEGVPPCEITGNCTFEFTSSFGRTGPVGITLPPGYGHADQQQARYPVVYVLHGYGQTPEDLQAAIVFLANWMNGETDSYYTRLPKAILVYVDGRCRVQDGGVAPDQAECIRGTFFTNSTRPDGPQMEDWWLELIDHIDQNYRTMGETTVQWTE